MSNEILPDKKTSNSQPRPDFIDLPLTNQNVKSQDLTLDKERSIKNPSRESSMSTPKGVEYMLELVRARMPFGRYKDVLLVDLPETYIMWFARKGFPKGKLGGMLQSVYEIKLNGLEYLLKPLRQ